jgi:orotate phosphoribosyltransferase
LNIAQMKESLKSLVQDSISKGPVKLASGVTSDFYIDGRLVTLDPRGAFYIANIMIDMLGGIDFDAVGGPTMGADPIIGALCYHLGRTAARGATGFIIRKEAKGHGLGRMIEGPALPSGARVVVVEDVVTSGGSVLKGIRAVEAVGAGVVKVLALVDREAGGREALGTAGYDYEPIFSRGELT